MDFDSLRTSIRCFRNEKLPFQRCCTYITPITTTKGYPCNVRRYIPRYCTVLTQGSLLVVGVRERDSLALIDARRYAKLGGTRAEQTASIGSDFASVTGKQTNSSTPELRLGIDPKGVYSQLHAISSILPLLADHHRTRCALRETVPIIRGEDYPPQLCYQITRLQSLAEMQRPPRSTDVTSNEWLRAKPIHPSIRPCAIGNSDFFHDFHDPHDPPPLFLSHFLFQASMVHGYSNSRKRIEGIPPRLTPPDTMVAAVLLVREIVGNRGRVREREGEGERKIRRRCFGLGNSERKQLTGEVSCVV